MTSSEFVAFLKDMASPAPRHYRPAHRDDDPRRAIDDALDGMSPQERSDSLVATVRALRDGSERYRWHALHAMRLGASQAFRDALVEPLTPCVGDDETEVREKFADGASARLDAAMLTQLHSWLGLPLS